jgi:hypothetical protein
MICWLLLFDVTLQLHGLCANDVISGLVTWFVWLQIIQLVRTT